jgi:hypothetical protein
MGQQVPFNGRLEGSVTITPVVPPFIVDVLIQGTGNATHLGSFTLTVPHRVDRSTGTGNGSYQFTAANGDMLYADFVGAATFIAPGVLKLVETATFTGGTGRFAGATGSFTTERVFDSASGITTGSFEGTISAPGH